jgi:dipeptidyl aminopeptidase/acylaminoacyl peptidase
MTGKPAASLFAALLAVLVASSVWAAEPAAAVPAASVPAMLAVPESITAQDVPPIPRELVEDLVPYENIRTAIFADWHPKERRMLIRTRFAESLQLHELAMPMGARTQVTYQRDPVPAGLYRPGDPSQILYTLDEGGAENLQLFLLDRRTGRAKRFTDGTHRYVSPLWSRDGKRVAYAANVRNGRDMDLYVIDPSTPGSERRVAEVQGDWQPLDWSPDDRRLLVYELISANEGYLHWLDVTLAKKIPP